MISPEQGNSEFIKGGWITCDKCGDSVLFYGTEFDKALRLERLGTFQCFLCDQTSNLRAVRRVTRDQRGRIKMNPNGDM